MQATQVWTKTLARLGEGQYLEYRIPGIAILDERHIAICYEGRAAVRDDWAQIDSVVLVSNDGGETFNKSLVLSERAPGESVTINNPTLIADGGTLHLIYHKNYALAYYLKSADFGHSWSAPRDITPAFREFDFEWNACATGPGHGARLENGRLIAPIWISNGERLDSRRVRHAPSVAGSIISDDGGASWRAGALLENVTDANETCVAEISGGRVLFNSRTNGPTRLRYLAVSPDGESGFSGARFHTELPDPCCFGGMTRAADGSLLFVNCDNASRRRDVRVKRSADEGASWQTLNDVDELGGYADIAVWGEDMYVLYEVCVPEANFPIAELRLKKFRLTEDE